MKQEWTEPRIIIGSTATGDFYYPRPDIAEAIWAEVLKGNHVLIAAPRRVGKSSVMEFMAKNCPKNTKGIFKNIEGIASIDGFYKEIYELMYGCLSQFQKIGEWFVEEVPIKKIGTVGIEIGEKTKPNYLEEIERLLPKIASKKIRIVLFLDELPEVLKHLYKNEKREEAGQILNVLRSWRQNWKQNFNFVLAGSVGIHHIVKTYEGRTADLNDLRKVPFEAFTEAEAYDYIGWATQEATIQYDDTLKKHLLSKIKYYLPYFINLMLDEINSNARKASITTIATTDIDYAFEKVVSHSDHFKEWKSRLYDYFEATDAEFLNETLSYIAHNEYISKRKLHDLAIKHQKQNNYIDLVDGLRDDGYIVEQADNYVFVSPFLQAFWKRQNPFYDEK